MLKKRFARKESEEHSLDNLKTLHTKREIDRSAFKVLNQIGSGNFGIVFKGEVFGLYNAKTKTTVAIKSIHGINEKDLIDVIKEINLMSYTKPHLNIVGLIGSCSSDFQKDKKLWLLMEFCEYGDLKNYLKDNESKILSGYETDDINHRSLLNWLHDVSQGMEHLALNNIMHGDLAARNILLGDDPSFGMRPIGKVADFGLAKTFYNFERYEKSSRLMVPWKWMAIEYLQDDFFTLKSDVWSYAVLVWEVLSFGRTPYGQQSYYEVLEQLKSGYRLPYPGYTDNFSSWSPALLYKNLSDKCFDANPETRISFSDIITILESYLSQDEKIQYAKMQRTYEEIRGNNYRSNHM